MNALDQTSTKNRCPKCQELRPLPLHLHELSLYCDLLSNQRPVLQRRKNKLTEQGQVETTTIAKWLRLAGQLETVILDTYQFQQSDLYCEPVNNFLKSDADHRQTLATPLTRFVFVCNGLEECYRFLSQLYEIGYNEDRTCGRKREYQRTASSQAAYLLRQSNNVIARPTHYEHLVDNLRKIILLYSKEFPGRIDIPLSRSMDLDYGLGLVRNMRNHVAHGIFPIIENPEYSSIHPPTKRNLVNLLGQSSRVAAINIQMLIAIGAGAFDSELYDQHCDDDEYGEYFRQTCDSSYLLSLHMKQDFGLNEEDYFAMLSSRKEMNEDS